MFRLNLFSKLNNIAWLDGRTITTVLIIKFLILAFGAQAYLIVSDQPITELGYLGLWKRWDAIHYLRIAENGYTAVGEDIILLGFFPLYPALIALFNLIINDYLLSAFLVSGLASLALALGFRELVKLDFSEKTAQYAVLFLFIFPTSYFLHIPYTESLFLALTIGCFLAARKRYWLYAGILGFFACLTRINGMILCFALLFEIWQQYSETKKFEKKWLYVFLIPLGFVASLGNSYFVTGNPLMFFVQQREHWNQYLVIPWYNILAKLKTMFDSPPSRAQMVGVQEVVFIAIGLFATIAGWRVLRPSYRAWMVANWLLLVSRSFILSVPRYTLTMFPLFILMGLAARRRWWAQVLFLVWSILFLALFITEYVRDKWAF